MKSQQELSNLKKYLKPPSIIEISEFIRELGISDLQFERYYELPFRTIGKIKNAQQNLPAKFWHLIYEKIVPVYGLSESTLVLSPVQSKKNKTLKKATKTAESTKKVAINRLDHLSEK